MTLLSLQALSAADFLKILEAILIVSAPCLGHAASIKDAVSDILAAARAPTALLAEAAQGCTEAITAASEAAHACWVRLLNARRGTPPKSTCYLGLYSSEPFKISNSSANRNDWL